MSGHASSTVQRRVSPLPPSTQTPPASLPVTERPPGQPPLVVPPFTSAQIEAIADAIDRDGYWEQHVEWRIATVTSTRIERTGEPGHHAYRVRVECDYVLEAECPTVPRAAGIAHAYAAVIVRLWQELGWPSWASSTQLKPD
jgi:hypothetical protein